MIVDEIKLSRSLVFGPHVAICPIAFCSGSGHYRRDANPSRHPAATPQASPSRPAWPLAGRRYQHNSFMLYQTSERDWKVTSVSWTPGICTSVSKLDPRGRYYLISDQSERAPIESLLTVVCSEFTTSLVGKVYQPRRETRFCHYSQTR